MSTDEMNFGDYLEFIRRSKRKSLRQTAIAIGVSPQYYSEVEKTRRSVLSAERLEKLRDYLEMTPEEYIERYGAPKKTKKKSKKSKSEDSENSEGLFSLFSNEKSSSNKEGINSLFK